MTKGPFTMRKLRALLLVAAGASIVLSSIPSHAATTTETYTAGFLGDVQGVCRQDNPVVDQNIGAVCFDVADSKAGTVKVLDSVTSDTVFFWLFLDDQGNCIGQPADPTAPCPNSDFAQGSKTLTTPAGAATLEIELSGPVAATAVALDPTTMATNGTVTYSN